MDDKLNAIPSMGGLSPAFESADKPVRESEIVREVRNLEADSKTLKELTEALISRLGSVISPKEIPANPQPQQTDYSPSTPLASNLHNIHNELASVKKAISFMLGGLEL